MPQLPGWLLGYHLVSVTITAQDEDASANLTDQAGGAHSVRGVTRRIRLSLDPQHEDIRPVVSDQVNNVITGNDSTLVLTCIKTRFGINPLADLVTSSNYFKAVFAWGGEVWTGYFTRGSFNSGVENFGANDEELTLRQVEVNVVGGSIQLAAAS